MLRLPVTLEPPVWLPLTLLIFVLPSQPEASLRTSRPPTRFCVTSRR